MIVSTSQNQDSAQTITFRMRIHLGFMPIGIATLLTADVSGGVGGPFGDQAHGQNGGAGTVHTDAYDYSEVTASVAPVNMLTITKSVQSPVANPGDVIAYTLVFSNSTASQLRNGLPESSQDFFPQFAGKRPLLTQLRAW